jgi:hypothetical protein
MLSMNRSSANPSESAPRRFVLLPEEPADGTGHAPRIRRYRLTSVGLGASRSSIGRRRGGLRGSDVASARIARGLGRPDRI